MIVIMLPNTIFAIVQKDGFENKYHNKMIETQEQIGRFGSLIFMIINVPYLYSGFTSETAEVLYLVINSVLCLIYCLFWIVYWRKSGVVKALALSILPSIVFIFSGCMLLHIPLLFMGIIFAPAHILISYKNAIL